MRVLEAIFAVFQQQQHQQQRAQPLPPAPDADLRTEESMKRRREEMRAECAYCVWFASAHLRFFSSRYPSSYGSAAACHFPFFFSALTTVAAVRFPTRRDATLNYTLKPAAKGGQTKLQWNVK